MISKSVVSIVSKVKYSIMYIIHMNGVLISLSLATGPDSHHCNLAVGDLSIEV